MGKEVVYCTRCGSRLLEEDFRSGRGVQVYNKYACSTCQEAVTAQEQQKTPPIKIKINPQATPPPVVRETQRFKNAASSVRLRPEAERKRFPVAIVGGAAAIVGGLIIAIALFSSGRNPSRPPAMPPPELLRSGNDQVRALVDSLIQAAATATEPDSILKKAEEIRPRVQGTEHETALAEIEISFGRLRDRLAQSRRLIEEHLKTARTKSKDYAEFESHWDVMFEFEKAETAAREEIKVRERAWKLEPEAARVDQETKLYLREFEKSAERAAVEVEKKIDEALAKKEFGQALEAAARFPVVYRDTPPDKRVQARVGEIKAAQTASQEAARLQWQSIFDGTMNRWVRLGTDEKVWRVENGVLVGTSQFPADDAKRHYSDGLYFDEDLSDYEIRLTFSAENEGNNPRGMKRALGLLMRSQISGQRGQASAHLPIPTEGKIVTVVARIEGNTATFTPENQTPVVRAANPNMPPTGKMLLALCPGITVRITKIELRRLK
jgi:DNA-directed RNA polymerase subunit RPC12/RpoP